MRHRVLSTVVAVFALATVALAARPGRSRSATPTPSRQTAATLVFTNGRILTVDASDRIAQAVAIAGNRIIAVGTTAEVLKLAGPTTERVDLKGRTMTPGLLDAHAHFSGSGGDRLFVLDLSYPQVKSIADIAAAVKAKAAALPKGTWITGRGWDEGKLAEGRLPTARDLDAASPDHPVYLTQTTGHYGVANSTALRAAGVTKETRDPPGGTIDRDAQGNPTGVLKEGAQGLVRRLVPPRSAQQAAQGIREMAKAFNAEGMTGAKDPGISPATFAMFQNAAAEGALPVRIFALWSTGRSVESAKQLIAERAATTRPYESTGDDHVIAGGVKLYVDGSGGARTAWLYTPWSKNFKEVDGENVGYPASSPDTVRQMIRLFHDAGMHVSVHSIGDRGIDWVVDTYDQAMRENPKRGLRHGIIHANIPTDHAIEVMARLQKQFDAGYPEPSASFNWWLGDTYAGNFGDARALRLNPFATYRRQGMIWANGSDYGVTPFAARYGIWSAVARETLLGTYGATPFGTAESVDVHTALKAVTIWAARQMFLEQKIGSIEVGKYADLAVWDRDFYRVPTKDLKDATCLLTVFDGRVVYRKDGAAL
jgi:predicted amidohydrolase YtcJ